MAAKRTAKKKSSAKKATKPASEKIVQQGFAGIRNGGSVRHYSKGAKHTVVFKRDGSSRPKRYSGGKAGADAAFAAYVIEAKS